MNLLTAAGMCIVREKWLPDCLQKHSRCGERFGDGDDTHKSRAPTRVVHVQDDGETAKLVDTASLPADNFRYLTLSHMWGSLKFTTLTMANLDSFKQRIPLEKAEFNQTFREAFTVTALLGYKYIWIDSLCIIQDAPGGADWTAECPRMTSVYSCSDLNLSASGYADAGRGMVAMSRAALVPPIFELADGDMARVVLQHEHKGGWPLETRGWVLQENLLVSNFSVLSDVHGGLLIPSVCKRPHVPFISRPVASCGSAGRPLLPRSGPSDCNTLTVLL
jgi:hypothetical protein